MLPGARRVSDRAPTHSLELDRAGFPEPTRGAVPQPRSRDIAVSDGRVEMRLGDAHRLLAWTAIVGLFVGPVVLAVTYTLLTEWVNNKDPAKPRFPRPEGGAEPSVRSRGRP